MKELRDAEIELLDLLQRKLNLPWAIHSYSGTDRESGRPLITIYVNDWLAGQVWIKEFGRVWHGYDLQIVEDNERC